MNDKLAKNEGNTQNQIEVVKKGGKTITGSTKQNMTTFKIKQKTS